MLLLTIARNGVFGERRVLICLFDFDAREKSYSCHETPSDLVVRRE